MSHTPAAVVDAIDANTLADGEYKIINEEGNVRWSGKKVGGEHFGDVKIQSGSISVVNGEILKGEIIIDMASISVEDIKDAEKSADLVGHLKSADFFDVEANPTASFKITRSVKSGTATQTLMGEMTIKGHTEMFKFDLETSLQDENSFKITSFFSIDRTKYGLEYKSRKIDALLDNFIYDQFDLKFSLLAKR